MKRHAFLMSAFLAAPLAADVKPDDTFWTLDGGTVTTIDHKAKVDAYEFRYQETQTDGDKLQSGKRLGTPTLGGCPGEMSGAATGTTTGGDPPETGGTFRINPDTGRMQQQDGTKPDGSPKWRNLRKKSKALEDVKGGFPEPCGGNGPNGTIGSLPDQDPRSGGVVELHLDFPMPAVRDDLIVC